MQVTFRKSWPRRGGSARSRSHHQRKPQPYDADPLVRCNDADHGDRFGTTFEQNPVLRNPWPPVNRAPRSSRVWQRDSVWAVAMRSRWEGQRCFPAWAGAAHSRQFSVTDSYPYGALMELIMLWRFPQALVIIDHYCRFKKKPNPRYAGNFKNCETRKLCAAPAGGKLRGRNGTPDRGWPAHIRECHIRNLRAPIMRSHPDAGASSGTVALLLSPS